jgi:hypothetical protein
MGQYNNETFDVNLYDKVTFVITILSECKELPPKSLSLFFRNQPLDINKKLSDYKLLSGDILKVHVNENLPIELYILAEVGDAIIVECSIYETISQLKKII